MPSSPRSNKDIAEKRPYPAADAAVARDRSTQKRHEGSMILPAIRFFTSLHQAPPIQVPNLKAYLECFLSKAQITRPVWNRRTEQNSGLSRPCLNRRAGGFHRRVRSVRESTTRTYRTYHEASILVQLRPHLLSDKKTQTCTDMRR